MSKKMLIMEVVTPEYHVCTFETDSIVLPAAEGYLGILPGHAPLIAKLSVGVVKYKLDGEDKRIALSGGFLEVANDKVAILADTAEMAETIDYERAMEAKARAEQRLRERTEEVDYYKAQLSLQKAMTRVKAAKGDD